MRNLYWKHATEEIYRKWQKKEDVEEKAFCGLLGPERELRIEVS